MAILAGEQTTEELVSQQTGGRPAHMGSRTEAPWGTTTAAAPRGAGTTRPHEGLSALQHGHSLPRAHAPYQGQRTVESGLGEANGSSLPQPVPPNTTGGPGQTELSRYRPEARRGLTSFPMCHVSPKSFRIYFFTLKSQPITYIFFSSTLFGNFLPLLSRDI